eukprot:UN02908
MKTYCFPKCMASLNLTFQQGFSKLHTLLQSILESLTKTKITQIEVLRFSRTCLPQYFLP